MKRQQGFTLMELLVVLLIIGVLSTVALRTIDATTDRAHFDQTAKEMKQLVQAITGNPDLFANGRRVDFGFYGDMGRLPDDLRELVENTSGSPRWHGPYLIRPFASDTAGYLYDAWGHPYTYDRTTGTIASLGNGRYPLTMRVAEDTAHLSQNAIFGSITDNNNSPPGEFATTVTIELYNTDGTLYHWQHPDPGGYYEFSPQTGMPVAIGNHMIRVLRGTDTIVRWATVIPRSRTVIDFRFTRPFRNWLSMVGPPELALDSTGFAISVVNEGATADTVQWIMFLEAPDSAYMRSLFINRAPYDTFFYGIGNGGTVSVTPPYPVPPNRAEVVTFGFYDFHKLPNLPSDTVHINGKRFRLRFSDGSEITVTP